MFPRTLCLFPRRTLYERSSLLPRNPAYEMEEETCPVDGKFEMSTSSSVSWTLQFELVGIRLKAKQRRDKNGIIRL